MMMGTRVWTLNYWVRLMWLKARKQWKPTCGQEDKNWMIGDLNIGLQLKKEMKMKNKLSKKKHLNQGFNILWFDFWNVFIRS